MLRRTGRRNLEDKATRIHTGLRSDQLTQPEEFVAGYVAVTRALVGLLKTLNRPASTATAHSRKERELGTHPGRTNPVSAGQRRAL